MTRPKVAASSLLPAKTRRRGQGRPWPKGVSGNPSGLPKGIGDVRALARAHTADAIRALVVALKDKSGAVRVRAAEALLDRAWGKSQPVQHDDGTAMPETVTVRLVNDTSDIPSDIDRAGLEGEKPSAAKKMGAG